MGSGWLWILHQWGATPLQPPLSSLAALPSKPKRGLALVFPFSFPPPLPFCA